MTLTAAAVLQASHHPQGTGITLQSPVSSLIRGHLRWHLVSGFSFSLGSRLNQGGRLDTAHWDYQISGLTLGPWAWHRSCAIETILLNSWCPHMTLSTVTWSNPIEDSWCSHMVCTKDVICRDLFAWQLHHHQCLVINTQSTEAKHIYIVFVCITQQEWMWTALTLHL